MVAKKKTTATVRRKPKPAARKANRKKVPPPLTEQQHIPGLEPERIEAIDRAAQSYYDTMKERVALSNDESDAKDKLLKVMHEHGRTEYETKHGLVVTLCVDEKLTCKKKKGEPEANGQE